jgi:hypothetical protein
LLRRIRLEVRCGGKWRKAMVVDGERAHAPNRMLRLRTDLLLLYLLLMLLLWLWLLSML